MVNGSCFQLLCWDMGIKRNFCIHFFSYRFLVSSKFLMFSRALRPNIATLVSFIIQLNNTLMIFPFVFVMVYNNINDDDVVVYLHQLLYPEFRRASEIQMKWKIYGKVKTLWMTRRSYLTRTWFISFNSFSLTFFLTANSSRIEFYLKEWIVVPYSWI